MKRKNKTFIDIFELKLYQKELDYYKIIQILFYLIQKNKKHNVRHKYVSFKFIILLELSIC